MGSLNRVHLMGWVATPPRLSEKGADGRCRLVVATSEITDDRTQIERHVVVVAGALAEQAAELRIGDTLYVEGRLERLEGDAEQPRQAAVIARGLWPLGERMPVDERTSAETGRTHASPQPHDRQGHWRRVARGRPEEHLVWVRATRVG
jgi:single-stranded DNA-binding protein